MVEVVESAYVQQNSMSATVVVKAANFEEAAGPAAKKLAIAYANKQGVKAQGYSGTSSPYPCDKAGKPSDDLIAGRVPIDHYRIDVKIQGTF
jgi:hypothetical protein